MTDEPPAIRDWAAVRPTATLRDVVALAVECLPGRAIDWVVEDAATLRAHVVAFVDDYARRRGVILSTSDITSELDALVERMKARGR